LRRVSLIRQKLRIDFWHAGKFHFWIDLVTKALRQGALADTINRFPLFAMIFKAVMPKAIDALKRDTRTHEAHTMALIDRY
jgi:hypothetical protein